MVTYTALGIAPIASNPAPSNVDTQPKTGSPYPGLKRAPDASPNEHRNSLRCMAQCDSCLAPSPIPHLLRSRDIVQIKCPALALASVLQPIMSGAVAIPVQVSYHAKGVEEPAMAFPPWACSDIRRCNSQAAANHAMTLPRLVPQFDLGFTYLIGTDTKAYGDYPSDAREANEDV